MAGQTDPDMAAYRILDIPQLHRQPGNGAVNFERFRVQALARVGDPEMAWSPVDKTLAKTCFQPLQGVADTRLLQQQTVGRGGDPALLHDRDEGPEQVPVQLPREPLAVVHARQIHLPFPKSMTMICIIYWNNDRAC